MAGSPDSGLEGRIATLESAVRSLMATNWTDRASVVDASGNPVPLSSLAFGQVADIWVGVGIIQQAGVAGQGTPVSSQAPASAWTYPGHPSVEVLVKGGRLRVDWAGMMAALGGNTGALGTWSFSYAVDFIGDEQHRGSVTQRIANPDYYRALVARDFALVGTYIESGNWYMHTGLAPGWYRVSGAWLLAYNSTTGVQPQGFTDNPRIAATPF